WCVSVSPQSSAMMIGSLGQPFVVAFPM
ncbi:MAG: hypothetical protein AVDCRST_MAG93-9406, partial [uncultured Chloroflexia bacterium]